MLAVDHHRLDQLVGDAQHRIERRHRVLEHHRDLAAAQAAHLVLAHGDDVAAAKDDLAAGDPALVLQQPNDRQRGDALARARFADDAERLAGHHLEAHAVDGADRAGVGVEIRPQVSDLEDAAELPVACRRGRGASGGGRVGRASHGCHHQGS